MYALNQFQEGLIRNRAGKGGVAVSVCSAHPDILRALFHTARQYDTFALIESTSNQVDQYGGYTGMQPLDFVKNVYRIAEAERFPLERILLGGDHLGTNGWQDRPAAQAMDEARTLVAAYVRAGYKKIHLDASFVCADDTAPLSDEITASRSAELAKVCEAEAGETKPLYVIGTEVPTPGGVQGHEEMHVTSGDDVRKTLDVFRNVFINNGLEDAWSRVIGLVVQPGVEFGDDFVHDYAVRPELTEALGDHPGMVYEAHSTDYQRPSALRELVQNNFYILKVGPWLSFALREGLFALEKLEYELQPESPSSFRRTLTQVMEEDPIYWRKYYNGTPKEIAFKLAFSYSDRARYYLGRQTVCEALERLKKNTAGPLPEGLVSQYLPGQYRSLREGKVRGTGDDLLLDKVGEVLDLYFRAGVQQP